MNLMGVLAAMGSEEQGLAFYEEVKSQAMEIRLVQPMSSRTQHIARWVIRGVRGEFGNRARCHRQCPRGRSTLPYLKPLLMESPKGIVIKY